MQTVYTIGYEGTDIERFIATLKLVGVEVVADVRAVAVSRKKGFSKTALRTRLEAEGIRYVHFVQLGDPKPGRDAARAGHYMKFEQIYTGHLAQPERQAVLGELRALVGQAATCLLCFERDPKVCHRSIVATRLQQHGMDVVDLFADSPKRYVDFTKKLARHRAGEGATAAQ